MNLTCIRHLATDWNEQGLLQGSRDISICPPAEASKKEISENQKTLDTQQFDLVLVSELKRTRETASLYGYQNPQIEALVNEMNFGKYEGISKQVFLKEQGEKWLNNPREIILGESGIHLEERIQKFIAKYSGLNTVLLFGHGAFIRGLLSIHKHGDIRQMNKVEVKNNTLVEMVFSNAKRSENSSYK